MNTCINTPIVLAVVQNMNNFSQTASIIIYQKLQQCTIDFFNINFFDVVNGMYTMLWSVKYLPTLFLSTNESVIDRFVKAWRSPPPQITEGTLNGQMDQCAEIDNKTPEALFPKESSPDINSIQTLTEHTFIYLWYTDQLLLYYRTVPVALNSTWKSA